MNETLRALLAERRSRVMELLGDDGALILAASPEVRVGRDLELRYRPDPELYYLTGFREPEAVVVLCPSHDAAPFTIFVRPRDPEQEVWTGPRLGPAAARELTGADAAHPITDLTEWLPKIVANATTLHARLGTGRSDVEGLILELLSRGRRTRQRSGRGPVRVQDPGLLLDEMRLIKDPYELSLIRKAAATTSYGLREGAARIRPGAGEWEVEAAIEAGFRSRGADGPAFATIVASGPNATVLHYIENARAMRPGELLLLDLGAHENGYNADVSRTFPVSGRFTEMQRALYDAVLAAHDAAIAAVRPGAPVSAVHEAALRVLAGAMVDLELLKGDVDDIVADEARYKAFYPHRTSHWLGLDVHDVGDYVEDGELRRLRPGMVLTVEPGLYVPAGREDVPAELRGVGVRLEDDVVVTETGAEVLTAEIPILPDDVAALVGG